MKWLPISIILILPLNAYAEDGFDDDGFDEEVVKIVIESAPISKGVLYGSIDIEAHQNISNGKNLSSLKTLVDIIGEYKFDNGIKVNSNLKSYHDFTYDLENRDVPNGYENEINLNELNIELEISSNFDFKTGRQIVVWGKSDSIRITDILNPLDNRTPGLVDIKNLRLGRTMSKLDYYVDNLNLSVIAIHENRFSENPKFGSDFKSTADAAENKPEDNLKNTSTALSLTGVFEGYDLGLYYADTYIDKPYLISSSTTLNYDNKSKMFGAAYNQVSGSFLLKAEAAHFDTVKYNGVTNAKVRTDTLLGIEYNGITDGSIGYEVALRKIHDYETAIGGVANGYKREEEYQQVVRLNQSYLNQTLDLSVVLSVMGSSAQDGGSARVSLDYAIDDETAVSGGVIDYIGGDNLAIDAYKDNDRIFATISRSF
ncbi:hypothetical protein [uncultured Gammaproteobacteria bacterium]|uniref:DUF1302 family protein n=1 Tax=Bathymodiolus heckerae thiotrophic gill symbiont TaxID=1052212 RepID=UPI0010B0E114|nr:DUF1302 family protein [Bathymodiolus heckerae thiotrophic gill symbiont]CAC9524450.1 hypothetical protein [uncultured Gammaproteobacteria bacterium]CAC9603403.1 hypothetical protein [uncultured Gammaproteobacteria bacterium]CAC9963282.1 hypothetical protein [uncultured Gammaproteobacteria bacterium]SHN89222.1 hypothetical protein BHECKSOX_1264 [Bathymodiolus heckerae thiotrophic gill symbiont]